MAKSLTDLELIHDSTDQTVGMRWTGLAIPQGATITAAYIQFGAKESQSVVTIGPNGKVKANIRAREVAILGSVRGNIATLPNRKIGTFTLSPK